MRAACRLAADVLEYAGTLVRVTLSFQQSTTLENLCSVDSRGHNMVLLTDGCVGAAGCDNRCH